MNTFLPYADFDKSAQSLDTVRLNKQILEATPLKVRSNDARYLLGKRFA